jgi:F420-dependent oxidoreductase-like protein
MIKVGLQIPNFTYPATAPDRLFESVAAAAVAAEDAGADTVMVMDHFYQLPLLGPPDAEMLEAYTLLGGLAARTKRVKLGTLVTGVTYRNPAILAKIVTTLDVISAGRAFLGIGAAWYDVEHAGLGVDFPPVKERFERLEEALHICRAMFRGERPTFQGKHYAVAGAINSPAPVTPGGPPIIKGGQGG